MQELPKILIYFFMNKRFPVFFIGIKELIENKKRLNRPKDMEDLKYLLKKVKD